MKKGGFIASFNYAVQGIISAIKTERNMKFHYLAALGTIIISLFMDLTKLEFIILLFSITLVVSLEMLNTAIERTVDLVVQEYNPIAKYVKDTSAGAVLLASINAAFCAYFLFFRKFSDIGDIILVRIKSSDEHLSFVAILIVLILTVGGKYLRAKQNGGSYFQGGAISGHTSLAFCASTIIALVAENSLVTFASFGIAALVGESRIEGKIHKPSEVISGALLGIFVAIFIFKVIS